MPPSRPLNQRFWTKVDVQWDATSCWNWIAGCGKVGYGSFGMGSGRHASAHRVAWELTFGPILNGLWVLHKCDNRKCVRPTHLFLGTVDDNQKDAARKFRFPHGVRHRKAKLTPADVIEIRRLRREGATQTSLAQKFGVNLATIQPLLAGRTWRHVGEAA